MVSAASQSDQWSQLLRPQRRLNWLSPALDPAFSTGLAAISRISRHGARHRGIGIQSVLVEQVHWGKWTIDRIRRIINTNQTDHGISALTSTFKVCYLSNNHGKIPELPSDGRNGLAFSSECVCLRTTNDTVCPLRR